MSELKLFNSQKRALRNLIAHYRASYETTGLEGFRIKPASLLVGPSGTGKSFVARGLSKNTKAPVLYLSLGNWCPVGSKGAGENNENSTVAHILNFIDNKILESEEHRRAIIFVDEIDKLSVAEGASNGNWCAFIFNELLRVLDGNWTEFGFNKSPRALLHLRAGTYFLFAGSFQKTWRNKMGSLDFVEQLEKPGLDWSDLQTTNALPDELLNRICSTIISIKPPGVDEISERVQNINSHFRVVMTQSQADAEAKRILLSGQFVRGLEAYFSSLGMRKYLSSAETQPEPGYTREEYLDEDDGFEALP